MIMVDVNILVYARVSKYAQHEAAREWLDRQLNSSVPVGLPWPSLLGFMRLVTNPRLYPKPDSIAGAWQQVLSWLACDPVWIPEATERHAAILEQLLASPGVHGNLVPDAHLAALAIEHGLTLFSADGDFARFSGLRWSNPLAA
ncbi:MAG: TA system VapC family ribonuclease toxin [Rhizomicrobium sp.]